MWFLPPFDVLKFNAMEHLDINQARRVLEGFFAMTRRKFCLCSLNKWVLKDSNEAEVLAILEAILDCFGVFSE